MCAIDPKQQTTFGLRVYTAEDISAKDFEKAVFEKVLAMEQALNADGRQRWHVHTIDDTCFTAEQRAALVALAFSNEKG
jgi:hypothetical protein